MLHHELLVLTKSLRRRQLPPDGFVNYCTAIRVRALCLCDTKHLVLADFFIEVQRPTFFAELVATWHSKQRAAVCTCRSHVPFVSPACLLRAPRIHAVAYLLNTRRTYRHHRRHLPAMHLQSPVSTHSITHIELRGTSLAARHTHRALQPLSALSHCERQGCRLGRRCSPILTHPHPICSHVAAQRHWTWGAAASHCVSYPRDD